MKALADTLNTIMAFSMIVRLVSFPALKDSAQLRPGTKVTIHSHGGRNYLTGFRTFSYIARSRCPRGGRKQDGNSHGVGVNDQVK